MNEVTIETPTGHVGEPPEWLAFVMRELARPDGFVIVDDGRGGSYAQARNHEGTLLLEFRDGSPERHFQTKDAGRADIARALSEWFAGERGFVERHSWRRLTL